MADSYRWFRKCSTSHTLSWREQIWQGLVSICLTQDDAGESRWQSLVFICPTQDGFGQSRWQSFVSICLTEDCVEEQMAEPRFNLLYTRWGWRADGTASFPSALHKMALERADGRALFPSALHKTAWKSRWQSLVSICPTQDCA